MREYCFYSIFIWAFGAVKKRELESLLSGVYSRDWVEDFEEPDEQTIEEGRKTIEFLIKR